MKHFLWLLLLSVVALCSCEKGMLQDLSSQSKKETALKTAALKGSYKGTFTRTAGAAANTAQSNVMLSFADGKFTGTSSLMYYPAICSGTYTAADGTLSVENTCFFTANFDWTFIFNGKYQYSLEGNNLTIWRDYGNNSRDLYQLTLN